jgi:hypothetical protein
VLAWQHNFDDVYGGKYNQTMRGFTRSNQVQVFNNQGSREAALKYH